MARKLRLISPIARALHLRNLGALRDQPAIALAGIALQAVECHFGRGAVIARAGERVTSVHVVTGGSVRVRGGGHIETHATVDHEIGMLALLARSEDGIDAVATSETTTLALSADDWLDLLEDNFVLVQSQIQDLARGILGQRKQIRHGTYLAPSGDLPAPGPVGERDLVERLLFMRRRGVFGQADIDALIDIALAMRRTQFAAGERLWEIGDPSGFLLAVIEGRVRCRLADGTEFFAGPGYPLGNLESQCREPRWYEAVAETEVTALEAQTDTFMDSLESNFEMSVELIAAMAQGLISIREETVGSEFDRAAAG